MSLVQVPSEVHQKLKGLAKRDFDKGLFATFSDAYHHHLEEWMGTQPKKKEEEDPERWDGLS